MNINNKKRILIVREVLGRFSEVFIYRMVKGINQFDVDLLTGEYINQNIFPYESVYIWNNKAGFIARLIFFLRRRLLNSSRAVTAKLINVIDEINSSDADLVCFQFSFLPVRLGKDINKINKKICIIHHGSDVNKAIEDKTYWSRLQLVW